MREYFRFSPLGSSPSRVASLLLLQSRMPPALVVEQGFHCAERGVKAKRSFQR